MYVSKRQKPADGTDKAALAETLKQGGVDVATLHNVYQAGGQNIYGLKVPGAGAVELWRKLRALSEVTGRWPVIVGEAQGVDSHADSIGAQDKDSPQQVLARAANLDAEAWFKKRQAENQQAQAEDPKASYETGQWPASVKRLEQFTIPAEILSGKPLPEVTLVLAPTKNPWEAPAWLMFGGWNECPLPEVQVCLLKYWHAKYGAEVVGISHDVMELEAARPPGSRDAALELAREQFLYCEDIVTQGVESVEALALTLLDGKIWYFWWD